MKRYFTLLFILQISFGLKNFAQDIHFSQFYASPLSLNPALSGFSEGSYRVNAIYRNQWFSVSTPYQTLGASFDMRLLENKLKNDIFGVGGLLLRDKAGDSEMGNTTFLASASYHKRILSSERHSQSIGIGLQGGYVQKSADFNNLAFPNQFVDSDFDLTQSNNENFSSGNIGYFDLQAGLFWHGTMRDKAGFFAGFTAHHLTQPKESFFDEDVKLASRYVVHGGSRIALNKQLFLTPNFVYMLQNKAKEINLGTAVEYHFGGTDPMVASLGGWYRVQDAAIATLGFEYKNVRLGLAYDFTTSELKESDGFTSAFEISLTYIGKIAKPQAGPVLVPCPRL